MNNYHNQEDERKSETLGAIRNILDGCTFILLLCCLFCIFILLTVYSPLGT